MRLTSSFATLRANLSPLDQVGDGKLDFPTNLEGAKLGGANFENARLGQAKLGGADLSRSNLDRADFTKADLHGANLSDAAAAHANFHGVAMGEVRNFPQRQAQPQPVADPA